MIYYTEYVSKVGNLTITSDGKSINGLWIEKQKYFMENIKEKVKFKNDLPIFIKTKRWLDKYFMGEKVSIKELENNLNPIGSEFRKKVWKILCEIPYGKTTTYGDIAKIMAKKEGKEKMSAQAVGNAVGHNPIGIIIPCHRVVGKDGKLIGYAGGLDKKRKLLELEGIDLKNNRK